jgi:hypothetical protein
VHLPIGQCYAGYWSSATPELNAAEQVFRHIRKHLSNTIFTTLDQSQNALIDELQQFWEHPTVLLQLDFLSLVGRGHQMNISSCY